MSRRIVLAIDNEGAVVAIGPVATDESVEKIREQIEAAGWENYGVVRHSSVADFRAELKAAAR